MTDQYQNCAAPEIAVMDNIVDGVMAYYTGQLATNLRRARILYVFVPFAVYILTTGGWLIALTYARQEFYIYAAAMFIPLFIGNMWYVAAMFGRYGQVHTRCLGVELQLMFYLCAYRVTRESIPPRLSHMLCLEINIRAIDTTMDELVDSIDTCQFVRIILRIFRQY